MGKFSGFFSGGVEVLNSLSKVWTFFFWLTSCFILPSTGRLTWPLPWELNMHPSVWLTGLISLPRSLDPFFFTFPKFHRALKWFSKILSGPQHSERGGLGGCVHLHGELRRLVRAVCQRSTGVLFKTCAQHVVYDAARLQYLVLAIYTLRHPAQRRLSRLVCNECNVQDYE